jgi:hypothetical protein
LRPGRFFRLLRRHGLFDLGDQIGGDRVLHADETRRRQVAGRRHLERTHDSSHYF